jgi:uncharacterized protein YfaS (alpha-2-macroglobulin family)
MVPDFAERADAFLHGLLTPEEEAAFERQLAEDAALRAALDVARRRLALLESALPPAEASEVLVRHTLECIDKDSVRRRRFSRRAYFLLFTPLAACAIILALFQTHYLNLAASPANLEIYGQNTLMPGSNGALRIRLTDKHTQAPLAGVPVEITLGEPGTPNFTTLASFTTDTRGNGQPSFHLPDWADGSYPLRVTAQTPKQPEVLTQRVQLKRSAKLLLTSDKPIYQPGQTIHLRALTLIHPDLKPAADAATTFAITDPRGNVIFKRVDRTSRFGIAAADCALADELIEGDYRIACRVGDTDSALSVRVEKYVLPKIRLTIATEQSWYQPGQEVRGTLTATYHHGEPAANAAWELEAAVNQQLLAKLLGKTDDRGTAKFSFRLPDGSNGTITIAGRVRDTAGQEQTARLHRRVDRKSIRLTVIPEGGVLVPLVPNTIYIYAQGLDGAPVEARGTVGFSGIANTEEPDMAMRDKSNPRKIATGELGIATLVVTPAANSILDLAFELQDAHGFNFRERQSLPTGNWTDDYLLQTDKATYTSGDTIHLTALARGSGPVFVDILKDEQTIRSDVIDVEYGHGELAVDIPAELFGTMELCSYRFDSLGRPVRKTRTLFIKPAHQLQVRLNQPKPEFRPGEKAKLDFVLTDERGRPTPGALSLAMVDEAVFDVRQSLPGLERAFYLLDQKLLAPAATLYPWSPYAPLGVDAKQRDLLEQALFASTVRASDSVKSRFATPPPPTHSLTAETFFAKQQATMRERADWLHRANLMWVLIGIWAAFIVYVMLWMQLPRLYMLILHGTIVLLLPCGIAIVLLSHALEQAAPKYAAASRSSDADMVRQAGPAGAMPLPGNAEAGPATDKPIRVRERFPETMLWQPQLITDDSGRASLDLEFADSITTWRLSAGAVAADGRLGAVQTGLRVFQPFFVDLNLPVALTRGDEIDVPAVVSNFQPKAQTVELTLAKAGWFELLGPDSMKLELKPREVRAASFRIRVKQVGRHELQVTAQSPELGDAVKREIEVMPDGRRVEQIANGTLTRPATVKLDLPADAIPGSGKAIVRIYPSSFSQLVDGLDGIFRLPTGCFEQTSSSLYPNVLALGYLRRFDKRMPEVEAKALGYIHAGYQRLLTFETPSGGFDWYGKPPGKVALTAYGLMEFRDMAQVHDVDPALIERTRKWLIGQRRPDGTWDDAQRYVEEDREERLLRTTAYVAWAVYDGFPPHEAAATREFLLRHTPESIKSAYTLALVCNALLAIDAKDAAQPYLAALLAQKQASDDGRVTWWRGGSSMTTFYGAGRAADVETTALAVLALIRAESGSPLVRSALTWLVEQREVGHWGSTQATILALKALMLGTGKPAAGPRLIDIALDGKVIKTIEVGPDEADVMKQLDFSASLRVGVQDLTLTDRSGNEPSFQVEFRYHVPGSAAEMPSPLGIDVKYDRTEMSTADALNVTATVTNRTGQPAPMVMLDLPVPAGFRADAEAFDKLVAAGTIDRYQSTPVQIIVYLRSLAANRSLELRYRLLPGAPAKLTVPTAKAWEYYAPERRGESKPASITVRNVP